MSAVLDDLSFMASRDPSGMLRQMLDLPSQLRSSLSSEVRIDMEPDKVCLCGLGGSAMGGDIVCDHLEAVSTVPAAVVRDVTIPKWVDGSTLALIISYSGNTRETLEMYRQAREMNASIVAITSGGQLAKACQECGETLVQVPSGLQPRAALGHLLGASAAAIESAGLASMATNLREMIPMLQTRVETCSPSMPRANNVAKQVAERLHGKMPFIYSSRPVRTAGKRWMTQINENSKMLCMASELPEANHNQLVGWIDGARDARNVPVFLRASSDRGVMADIMRATLSIFEDYQLGPVLIDLDGETSLENVMQGIVIGDFVSYYLAMLNGVDPLPVSSISELKKRLG
jgi:glucose/mannose-6-phosphate isomerase